MGLGGLHRHGRVLMKCRGTKTAAFLGPSAVGRRGEASAMTLITPPHSGQGGGSRGRRFRSARMLAISSFRSVVGSPPVRSGAERQRASFCGSVAIGEESEVANAMESVG